MMKRNWSSRNASYPEDVRAKLERRSRSRNGFIDRRASPPRGSGIHAGAYREGAERRNDRCAY